MPLQALQYGRYVRVTRIIDAVDMQLIDRAGVSTSSTYIRASPRANLDISLKKKITCICVLQCSCPRRPAMRWYERILLAALRTGGVPTHVAFVMDGNRRYARQHLSAPIEGHERGYGACNIRLCHYSQLPDCSYLDSFHIIYLNSVSDHDRS